MQFKSDQRLGRRKNGPRKPAQIVFPRSQKQGLKWNYPAVRLNFPSFGTPNPHAALHVDAEPNGPSQQCLVKNETRQASCGERESAFGQCGRDEQVASP